MTTFRTHHLHKIFSQYDSSSLPLDILINKYFRSNKALGSKDRRYLGETLYGIIRWRGLIDYLCNPPLTWEKRIAAYSSFSPRNFLNDEKIPIHRRLSFPKILVELLETHYGMEKTIDFCLASNERAPLTIRVNRRKITREKLLNLWQNKFDVYPTSHSSDGIGFSKRAQLFGTEEYSNGFFEIQDEASQLAAQMVEPKPGQRIFDYCAGSGGKSLALASHLADKGQILLHDVRHKALLEAKKRLKRAGVSNYQIVLPGSPMLKKLKGKMDWVFVDAPCSGSGTWRRNPEQKWNFTPDFLSQLVQTQQEIVSKAIEYLAPNGHLVYATCSIFPEENEQQLDFFHKQLGLRSCGKIFSSFPTSPEDMDGFFAAKLLLK